LVDDDDDRKYLHTAVTSQRGTTMNEHINLDDSVLAPKRPLSIDPADTEGHVHTPIADDSEDDDDTEGHVYRQPDDETEGPLRV
jgi:hypothetical protein